MLLFISDQNLKGRIEQLLFIFEFILSPFNYFNQLNLNNHGQILLWKAYCWYCLFPLFVVYLFCISSFSSISSVATEILSLPLIRLVLVKHVSRRRSLCCVKASGLWDEKGWIKILHLPLHKYINLGKLLYLPVPQISFHKRNNNAS